VPAPASAGIDSTLVAADPAQAGTFTVAVLNTTGTAFQVFVTRDDGTTWTGPTMVTDNSTTMKFKPWINYSLKSVVGLMWRSTTQPGSSPTLPFQVFAAISDDQGATWSAPLPISTAPSPGTDPLWTSGGDRDDTSVIALNSQGAFIGWGDWRPGDVQGFFSAVKLQAFNHQ
jgi:hypothetical protein